MAIYTGEKVIQIWPGSPPGSEDWMHQDQVTFSPTPDHVPVVRNVVRPTLRVSLPDPSVATGTGVIVCPGGAFHFLAIEHEGTDVASWLVARGIAACVLSYRVAPTPPNEEDYRRHMLENDHDERRAAMARVRPLAIADGQQAMRRVREHAAAWDLQSEQIGMLGFSAGAMVTCGVVLANDPTTRPAFAAPIYGAPFEEFEVPADAPPLFMALASDDALMASRTAHLYSSWLAAGRSVELHSYATGGHGFGMRKRGQPVDGWIDRFYEWLQSQGFGTRR